jgi:Na+-transporting NADH:ubiquinone oxidoreductase subunit A
MADATVTPKSIFVNGMATAPFQADIGTVIKGNESAFQAGLNALTRLTAGKVHLCLAEGSPIKAGGADVHFFAGPHPAGNTSVHIHHIDPIQPKDVVWAVKAVDLIQIGRLFLEGALPSSRVIAVGGPGVADGARKYYRVRIGSSLKTLLDGKLVAGETRIIGGDALAGAAVAADSYLRFADSAITVLLEDRERHYLGWIMPGLNFFSRSRTFLSRWLKPNAEWALGTNTHGSPRAMVLTGLYDQVLPMNILVDYLVRAVLAHDTDEAVKLGLLEVDPEDFALCAFVCPSKMDVVAIIRQGLAEVEKEGI